MTKTSDSKPTVAISPWFAAAGETLLILLLFFLYAGGNPPDANEAHYLAKAKHYWNPSWCAGDLFLESADAHYVFYWTIGWLTTFLPLSAVAWVGRVVTWGLLAWSWQRLSYALAPRAMLGLISAGLFLSLNQRCHLAGEWVVGGFEAKGIAYVFVWLALEALVRDRWRTTWLLLGAACSFHVLVGGWSVVAAGIALLAAGKSRPSFARQMPALVGGLLLALPGLLPALALTWGVERAVVAEANSIYVFERLAHHLLPHRFEPSRIVVHLMLVLIWGGVVLANRRLAGRELDDQAKPSVNLCPANLQVFVGGALFIALLGASLDLACLGHPPLAAALMRYYWLRLSDAMLPLGVAVGIVCLAMRLEATRPATAQWLLAGAMIAAGLNLGATFYLKRIDMRPGADLQSLPVDRDDPERTSEIYEDWRAACRWVSQRAEPGALFLTPRRQQTFKWYAGRGEVFCWKDIPQDAVGLVEWQQRRDRIFPAEESEEADQDRDLMRHSDRELAEICVAYDARYLVLDRTASRRRPGFLRVYPPIWNETSAYEVFDMGKPLGRVDE